MKRVEGMLTGPQFLAGVETFRTGELGLYDFKPELAQIAASPRLATVRRLDLGRPNSRTYSDQYNPRFAPLRGEAFAVLFGSPYLAALRDLFVTELKLGALSIERIAAMPALTSLSLESCGVGDEGVRALVKAPALKWLELADNGITADGAAVLASWLSQDPARRVRLSRNPIGARGARAITESAPPGGELSFARFGLTGADVVALVSLPAMARVAVIDLSGNLIRDEGAAALAEVKFVAPPLLQLEGCAITDASALALLRVTRAIDLRRNQLQELEKLAGPPTAHLEWIGLTGNPGATAYEETNEGGVVIWAGSRDLNVHEIRDKFGFRRDLELR